MDYSDRRPWVIAVVVLSLLGAGCAQVETLSSTPKVTHSETGQNICSDDAAAQAAAESLARDYRKPIRKIQALDISIPARDIKRFPQLTDLDVGKGVYQYFQESLNEARLFTLFPGDPTVLERLLELWEAERRGALSGLAVHLVSPVESPEMLAAVDLFDFVACAPTQTVALLRQDRCCVTQVSIQVQLTDRLRGGAMALGTTDPESVTGKYIHRQSMPIWKGPDTRFEQAAVGIATRRAIRAAVRFAIRDYEDKVGTQ